MSAGEIVPADALYPTMAGSAPAASPDAGAVTEKRATPAARSRDTILTKLYPTLAVPPEIANVNFSEVGATDEVSYASVMPSEVPDKAELAAGLAAAVKHGVGVTQMRALVELEAQAVRAGEALTPEAGMAALRELWGDRTEARVAVVTMYARKIQRDFPGFRDWVERTRLGNYPPFVAWVYEIVKDRPRWPL